MITLKGVRLRHLSRIVLPLLCLAISCVIVTRLYRIPTNYTVKSMFQLYQTIGLLAVTVYPCLRAIGAILESRGIAIFDEIITPILKGLILYSIALICIGNFGDLVYRWTLTNWQYVPAWLVGILVVFVILYLSNNTSTGINDYAIVSGNTALCNLPPAETTDRDKRYMAAHEAGHALLYAALQDVPNNFKLVIRDYTSASGLLGAVTQKVTGHQLDDKSYIEWEMLVFLSGQLSESLFFDQVTLGSGQDHARWLNSARKYLSNQLRGMYYADPQNALEQAQNEMKLESLKVEQVSLLKAFFDVNKNVLEELYLRTQDKKTVTLDEIMPLLRKVIIPEDFPLPEGTETIGRKNMTT